MSERTKAEGLALAQQEVQRHFAGEVDVVILEDLAEDTAVGWVFPFESRAYLETGEFGQKLVGEGPILVREDGQVVFMGTAHPPEWYVEALENGEPWE